MLQITKNAGTFSVKIIPEGASLTSLGNSGYVAGSEQDLADSRISTSELVAVYNDLNDDKKPIKKFQDRATAVRRTWAAIEAMVAGVAENLEPEAEEQEQSSAVATDSKKGRKAGTSKNAGKRIYAKCQVNPRRAGTFGWHSYNLLLGKSEGVAYEDYITAGGRAKDLAWDVARKWAEVK